MESLRLAGCCLQTVSVHAINNPMMTCSECRKIIKCFADSSSFRNYRKFCISRGRKFATEESGCYHIIAFDKPCV